MNVAAELAGWLAAIFAAPVEPGDIAHWRSPEGEAALAALAAEAGVRAEVAATLAALGADPAALERAYHRLFSGLAGPRTVAPYQSVFTSPRGLLWQEPAGEMKILLERYDLHPDGVLAHEAPDHLAVELALLAELLRRRDEAGVRHLLAAHLVPWVGRFAEACGEVDEQGFYAAAARAAARLAQVLHDGGDGGLSGAAAR
jgi:TorA maturation chaperone TorD